MKRSSKRPELVRRQLGSHLSGKKNIWQVCGEFANLYETPSKDARLADQALCGELVEVLTAGPEFCRIRTVIDEYEGWVCRKDIAPQRIVPTHWVAVPAATVRRKPDDKSYGVMTLGMGSLVRVLEERGFYVRLERHGWVVKSHLKKIGDFYDDFVFVAKMFVGARYEWGGRYAFKQDCSAILQHAMHAIGRLYPRDTKNQVAVAGSRRGFFRLRRRDGKWHPYYGCIVFWKGHVGIVVENGLFLHGTGDEFNCVRIENFEMVVSRRREREEPQKQEIIAVLRL